MLNSRPRKNANYLRAIREFTASGVTPESSKGVASMPHTTPFAEPQGVQPGIPGYR
jgi:hypothetical protein